MRTFNAIRDQLAKQGEARLAYNRQTREFRTHGLRVPGEAVAVLPAPLDIGALDADLKTLPAEFERYLRGAIAWHNGDPDTAEGHFLAVLGLPEAERAYRSTWAAYMLGRIYAPEDPAESAVWYGRTCAFGKAGFHDSNELAPRALYFQARAEAQIGATLDSICHYAEAGVVPDDEELFSAACLDPAVALDPMARELLSASLLSDFYGERARKWLTVLEQADGGEPIPDAGRQAWAMYRNGQMEAARRWVALAPAMDPTATWVRGKLALREGRIEEGNELLEAAVALMPAASRVAYGEFYQAGSQGMPAQDAIWGDRAISALVYGDYATALTALLSGNHVADVNLVGLRVLTIDELTRYTAAASAISPATRMPFLLAHRLARAGAWHEAASILPEVDAASSSQEWANIVRDMDRWLLEAKDARLPNQHRAEAFLSAGSFLLHEGHFLKSRTEMRDTSLERDLSSSHLGYHEPWIAAAVASGDLARRLASTVEQPKPEPDNHYAAADLFWQAAALLPDNHPATAKALYDGGMLLENKDPKAADRFYKALVRRNPNLLIAQQADELRWFPDTFTDEVVFTPWARDPAPLLRKRYRVLLAVIAVGALTAAGLYASRRIRKSRTALPQ
ncbi:MAG: hypothetical protein HC888_11560 [Candidatus Competibacteraceae bacterium]|nr:hypothetical protein [Candidatus Competibacteraceae bacterium]